MLKQIRKGMFETNSSSTHSICIATNPDDLDDNVVKIFFECGEFGWEVRKLKTLAEKASYLYTAILCLFDKKQVNDYTAQIINLLHEEGIEAEFQEPTYYKGSYGEWCDNASIDYGGDGELEEFINYTLSTKKHLMNYLLSNQSFILTGNDNDDIGVDINVEYDHKEFYKGN